MDSRITARSTATIPILFATKRLNSRYWCLLIVSKETEFGEQMAHDRGLICGFCEMVDWIDQFAVEFRVRFWLRSNLPSLGRDNQQIAGVVARVSRFGSRYGTLGGAVYIVDDRKALLFRRFFNILTFFRS